MWGNRGDNAKRRRTERGEATHALGICDTTVGREPELGVRRRADGFGEASPHMSYSFMVLSQQSLLRGLLRTSLSATHSAEWVAEYATVDDFLAASSHSEALILDCDTCRITEAQADAIVRSRRVRRVVFLTDTPGTYHVHCLFHFGFHGVLHKRDSVEEFDAGMSAVLAGSIFISAHVRAGERGAFTRVLSEREITALRVMALHSTLRSAAEEMSVSLATLRTHRRNIFAKLGLHSQTHLVAFSVRAGVVSMDEMLTLATPTEETSD